MAGGSKPYRAEVHRPYNPGPFQGLGRRSVVAQSDGGDITSDAGALLLREQEYASGVICRFAACFEDFRSPDLIDHSVRRTRNFRRI